MKPKNNTEIESKVGSNKNQIPSSKIKIPSFEWKQEQNKGTKSVEYYLNIYYKKKHEIKNTKEEKTLEDIENLPFNYKEHQLSLNEEEKITQILKKQIIFQDIPPEILDIIKCEMIRLLLPKGKIIYDLNDEGNFCYIISKGKIVINIQNNKDNFLT